MTKRYLIMYEVSQKQGYIFRSNKLLENTGASYIIRDLTERPKKLFENLIGDKFAEINFDPKHKDLPDPQEQIVGGGQAIYVFNEEEDANNFSRLLSANVLRYFPGLELFLVKKEVDWNEQSLNSTDEKRGVIEKLSDQLSNKKNRREHAVFQKSFGIHQTCSRSGLPANTLNKFRERVADEFVIKDKVGLHIRDDHYKKRFILENIYLAKDEEDRKKYDFIKHDDFEDVFAEDAKFNASKSYLSIVSLDGNAMGVKVKSFFDSLNEELATISKTAKKNNAYLKGQKTLSKDIDDFFTKAFQKTISHVMKDFDRWAEAIYGKSIFAKENKEYLERFKRIIPIRPVISSGDDVSFITFGVLGVEITRIYLQYLQQTPITIGEETSDMNACAGVAIIPFRYPFWLGFALADSLCDHAKAKLQADSEYWKRHGLGNDKTSYDTSLIDWQLVEKSGSIDSIKDFREQFYQTKDQGGAFANLTMRPYYIQKHNEPKKHFASYERTFLTTIDRISQTIARAKKDESKGAGVSKWKQLRDVYHQGVSEVDQWVLLNQFKALSGDVEAEKNPFKNEFFLTYKDGFGLLKATQDDSGEKFAFYYDALEIYDYFVRLSEVEKNESFSRNDRN